MADIMKIDIYELLNISLTADEKEIKRAYRKKALSCHPDKNPDNPQAAELFQQLSEALKILTDEKAKKAYDQVLKARKANVVRNRELDSKRKKLKEDLEAREKAALDEKIAQADAAKTLQKEIERLRKEGSKHLEEENEFLRQQILKNLNTFSVNKSFPRLKIKWTVPKGSIEEDYSEEELRNILEKHGHVSCLVISKKKKGTAIAEFSDRKIAEAVVKNVTGKPENPLKFSWISGEPASSNFSAGVSSTNPLPKVTPIVINESSSTLTSRDYESLVIHKLRQAEERKRLIQQIQDEES